MSEAAVAALVGRPDLDESEDTGLHRRVPIAAERPAHQVLEDILAELKSLSARAGAGESRSSASVKDSTRGIDLEVKSYFDGLLEGAVDDAVSGYARGRRKLGELQANQWVETVGVVP